MKRAFYLLKRRRLVAKKNRQHEKMLAKDFREHLKEIEEEVLLVDEGEYSFWSHREVVFGTGYDQKNLLWTLQEKFPFLSFTIEEDKNSEYYSASSINAYVVAWSLQEDYFEERKEDK